ncbi:MAG: hypothetical protein P1U32_00055 [Legionellaceae bacterium]|nr:hypothetical protein [Legionellaceae bacterium]
MGGGQSVEAGGSSKAKSPKQTLHIAVKEKNDSPLNESKEGDIPQSTASLTTRTQYWYRRFFGSPSAEGFAEELGFRFDALKAHGKAFFKSIMSLPEREELLPQHEAALAQFRNAILEIRSQIDAPEKQVQKLLPHHLNQVVHIIQLKNALPNDCASLLDDYLRAGLIPSNFSEKIMAMTHRGAAKIPQFARERRQFHHDVPHAVRLKLDVQREIEALNIWQNDTHDEGRHPKRDAFLREVTFSIAMLHDYYQKNEKKPGSQAESAEEATAEQVYEWLLEALDIPLSDAEASPGQNTIKKLLKLMCYQQIVGGTTVLLGDFMAKLRPDEAVASLNLMALEPIVERVLLGTGGGVLSRTRISNARLMAEIDEVAEVLSKNDKVPGAALVHTLNQVRKEGFATVPLLETYYGGMPMLRSFFEHYYTPYFSDDVLRPYYTAEDAENFGSEAAFFEAVNQQNFFTHFTPHWFMPLEFIPEENAAEARLIADFIALCRREYLVCKTPAAFNRVFDAAFERCNIAEMIATRFFREGSIAFERKFIDSQKKALEQRAHVLKNAGVSPAVIQLVVDPNVSDTDNRNIAQLARFYHEMKPIVNEKDIIKELMMAAIFSEGQLMAYKLGLDASQQAELDAEKDEVIRYSYSG